MRKELEEIVDKAERAGNLLITGLKAVSKVGDIIEKLPQEDQDLLESDKRMVSITLEIDEIMT